MAAPQYVIIGGVGGGMSVAARLRRLDEQARVIVLEQGEFVSFANCGLPYYLGGEIVDQADLLVQTPKSLQASLNLDVRTHHQVVGVDATAKTVHVVTPDGEQDLSYDQLILSPGSLAARPPIPGLDHPCVHTLRTVDDAVTLRTLATTGATHAVVLGAGFIGLEAAEGLRHQGLDVTIVEAMPHVLPPLEQEMAWSVAEELRALGIDVREGVAASHIKDASGRALVQLSNGESVTADIVLLSVGAVPATEFLASSEIERDARGTIVVDTNGRTNMPGVWAVGDATTSIDAVTGVRRAVPLAGPANRAGRLVADAIAHADVARPVPRPFGTAIVRVGSVTAAMTGANRVSLDAAGMAYTTLHLHPLNHAGYFPGGEGMHLIVHMDPASGKLLGAQGVGGAGVDKRIDVLATAMHAGLTGPDLIDLDLCYSPPYGSAKDPITMAGLMADNVLTGQTVLWYAQDLDWATREALVLDVRTPAEFATGHVPGALNIAHTVLRKRLNDVTKAAAGRPVAVMCAAGVRSYIAHRVLVDAGFDSRTLSGGMATLRAWLGAAADSTLTKETTR